jgi:hypothetical protein
MPRKPIPDDARDAVKNFIELPDGAAQKFVAALKDCSPTLMVTDLAAVVAKSSGLSEGDARKFLRMLGSMSRSRAGSGQTIEQFVSGLRATLAEQRILDPETLERQWLRVSKHIAAALRLKAIEISSKALSVLTSNERVLCHTRILSDIRPVFADDDLEPSACLILHQLKIVYHVNEDYETTTDMYVTLEHTDLERLKSVVDRALKKHVKMVAIAKKSEMPVLAFKG